MKINNRYKQAMERAKESPAFWTESALLNVARHILARMKELGINQASLAEKMGKKTPYISRLLSGRHNVTVETLSTAAHALGMKIDIRLEPIHEAKKSESMTFTIPVGGVTQAKPVRLRLIKADVAPVQGTITSEIDGSHRKAA
ncbi:helix-turn-helix domain-containing protein [Burkholderia stabilis]|uniref:Helix-turn-helix n=1 Tax=Burkholderia stabilis TaxID=95485 RepID=A0AAJ5T5A4_9BURK|nr:helix-turn-helix transcriptional regulator [Burkholderia stabilis]VBB13110.1 Helix-turn-helix [Burkholderia stabilis]